MKYAMLLGGLLGFASVFLVGLSAGKVPTSALVEASVGSIAGGLLFRWVALIWIRNVKEMLMEKRQAAVVAIADAEERRRQREAKETAS